VKLGIGLLVAVTALAGARVAKQSLVTTHAEEVSEPFTPTPQAAPFVSLGYREAASDVLFVRLLSYFTDENSNGPAVASLADAIAALDPNFKRIYELGANAMTIARANVDQTVYQRAISLLERGMKRYPDDWHLPYLAGQIYTQDLVTEDPKQRRAWDERGILLIESAIRKPGAPSTAASWAAIMRTRLGQHERAVQGLREMVVLTSDTKTRQRLIDQLAALEEKDRDALALELNESRVRFLKSWYESRKTLPASFFVLLGKRLEPGFDLGVLATGGRDLIGTDESEALEPLGD
jgi:tetratricopeptide (TPR) repeat protein